MVKAICDKPTENIVLNSEKLKASPPKIRIKTRVSTLTTIIQLFLGVLATAIREEKETKGIQIRKEVKCSLQMT